MKQQALTYLRLLDLATEWATWVALATNKRASREGVSA